MSVLRFAMHPRVLKLLGALKKSPLVPQGAGEWAWRFGPEAAYAGFAAASAPEGTSLGDRALIGLEDAGIGIGASILGQTVGLGTAGGIARARRLNPTATRALQRQAVNVGDMALQLPVNYYAPRPMLEGAYADAATKAHAAAEAQQREEKEALIAALLGTGVIAGRSLPGPATSKALV